MRILAIVPAMASSVIALGCRSSSAPVARTSVDSAAPAPVIAPGLNAAKVDEMIRAEWAKGGITPAPRVDDARFLRRVYLDVVGTIPPPEVVTSFALDAGRDKRARLVEALLASPAYAEHWATYWSDELIGQVQIPVVDKGAFRRWLVGRFVANAPYDRIVNELLTAEGVSSQGGPRYGGRAAATVDPTTATETHGPGAVNGAVNWFVKYKDAPQDLAGSASRVFLGVQIQCAQCHDHKTEKWKQEDFRGFASCFMRTRTEVLDKGMAMGLKRVDVVDIARPLPRFLKNPELVVFTQATPRALDGSDLSRAQDPRQALAAWITSPKNPWFAQAIVNRMWAHFLGRGFVNPIDDFRPSNPVSAPDVLSAIAADFRAQGNDLQRLVRLITSTEVYQLASSPRPSPTPAVAVDQDKLWPRFRLEPLGPEELLNAIMDATGVEGALRANGNVDMDRIRFVLFNAYSYLFDVDEEFDQADFEGTISQALALLNGRLVGGGASSAPGTALSQILARPGTDAEKVEALYLRTVSRRPSPEETEYFVKYVNDVHPMDTDAPAAGQGPRGPGPLARLRAFKARAEGGKKGTANLAGPDALARLEQRDARAASADPKLRAYEDVFWSLLNSSEFAFNH